MIMNNSETETLDDELKRNDYNDTLVRAFNTLPEDKRQIFISYMDENDKIVPTARRFNVSAPTMRKLIEEIKKYVIETYERMLRTKGEYDYLIDYYRRTHAKQQHPVVRAALYDWTPIAKYDSIEEAANAVSGKPEKILNVCNNHSFKYLGTRWFWQSEWEKQKTARSKKTHR